MSFDINKLNTLVTRAVIVSYLSPVFTLPVVAGLGYMLYESHQVIKHLADKRPIAVVPGAVAGVYTPGLSNRHLIDAGRYWANLITNYSRKNAAARLAELEALFENGASSEFQGDKMRLLQEVEATSQGSSFSETKGTAKVTPMADGVYEFSVRGDRKIDSAGILMQEDEVDINIKFRLGTPSKENEIGAALLDVKLKQVPGSRKK